MTHHTVDLNVDRNGNITSVQPEAVRMRPGDSVSYVLVEPGTTNWKFMGVQFSRDANNFSQISIAENTIMLVESLNRDTDNTDSIEVTLLYMLAKLEYYGSGDDPTKPPPRSLNQKHTVRAFDPLILNEP